MLYVIQQNLKTEVKDLEYYWIIIDESTYLSIHKKLLVYLRYTHNGEMNTELIGNIRIKDGKEGAQWLSGRVLDSRPKGWGFEPHWSHCVVVLEQDTFILA